MRKTGMFLSMLLFIAGCSKQDPLNHAGRNVVSEEADISFSELLLLVDIKVSDSSYLVVQSVDSVNLFVNNGYWARISSESIDTSKIEKYSSGNMFLSGSKLSYLLIAPRDVEYPDFTSAGDYAKYLNASYSLEPGEYVCFIESFQLTLNDNSVRKFYPYEYITFKVEDKMRSAFAGEIQLNIK